MLHRKSSDEYLHDEILRHMDPVGLLRYGQASRGNHGLVEDYIRREFVIDHVLRPFIREEEIPVFRKIQKKTHMLISGSVALQFFLRTVPFYSIRTTFFLEKIQKFGNFEKKLFPVSRKPGVTVTVRIEGNGTVRCIRIAISTCISKNIDLRC